MKRIQIGMRHLFLAVLLTAIVTSFISLNVEKSKLHKRGLAVDAHASRTNSEDQKFKVLRGLSVELDHQRDAIQTLLTYWDRLQYRYGLWPELDERKLNTMIFSDAHPRGATVTVVVLMDWDENKAFDAVSFTSDPNTEQHIFDENFDDQDRYYLELWTHPPSADQLMTKRKKWTLGPDGLIEQPTEDRAKR